MIVPLPEPYSFDLSLERYRTFGPDPAALWHEGGLHRVFAGVEVRIEAAPRGVRIEPGSGELAPDVLRFLGAGFDLDAFGAFATGEPVLREIVPRLAGFRPPIVGDPWEALVGSITAQQVSLYAALAIRTRFVERFGERVELRVGVSGARAGRGGGAGGAGRARVFAAEGRVHGRARAERLSTSTRSPGSRTRW